MRWLLLVLLALLGLFQYQLWFGEGGLSQNTVLKDKAEQQAQENRRLEERNQGLTDAVTGLRDGLEGIEERARYDLGMVREGETFYMVIEADKQP
ncbi:MAG: cell division protein FtsB [Gammaproteobacteria bacterium]|nr:MAG: cell division protein FtsB [Gammaproteobacteria bacterium]RLA54640.1 MAG: cell division protein FtsB [Gammaproteobacteria bacterium]